MGVTSSINNITLIYKVNTNEKKIRIFGDYFVETNKLNCKLKINSQNII